MGCKIKIWPASLLILAFDPLETVKATEKNSKMLGVTFVAFFILKQILSKSDKK
jgi:hypothetical protein